MRGCRTKLEDTSVFGKEFVLSIEVTLEKMDGRHSVVEDRQKQDSLKKDSIKGGNLVQGDKQLAGGNEAKQKSRKYVFQLLTQRTLKHLSAAIQKEVPTASLRLSFLNCSSFFLL